MKKPPLRLQVTTLWDYPSQHYGTDMQGDKNYAGATPSYLIWNLLERYTTPGNLVVDPMCGSGTTLDVARDCDRRALGYDLQPQRKDIFRCDARKLPIEDGKADFVFIDPPYSTHLKYSGDPACLGELSANQADYYQGMAQVIAEIYRILKPERYMALYISDSFVKGKPFMPIGPRVFQILERFFEPIDIVSVVRHNKDLEKGNYRQAADEGNFYLRGFNYLFIMKKVKGREPLVDQDPFLSFLLSKSAQTEEVRREDPTPQAPAARAFRERPRPSAKPAGPRRPERFEPREREEKSARPRQERPERDRSRTAATPIKKRSSTRFEPREPEDNSARPRSERQDRDRPRPAAKPGGKRHSDSFEPRERKETTRSSGRPAAKNTRSGKPSRSKSAPAPKPKAKGKGKGPMDVKSFGLSRLKKKPGKD
ncbi:MAG: hypothetical protein H6510_05955 [Acidobacteria bacterium]|nr:hypothetical protein [Acidobacteriota bacterium]MCB9397338.1 hypothetical protein [Acidobacteriota bacterium]